MDLQQLSRFVRVVELGSIDRASLDLQLSSTYLNEEMAQLQRTLSVSLLQVMSEAVVPTDAGLAFFRESRLALRHADHAAHVAQESTVTGTVSVGLTPTACSVLGLPLLNETRKRYPDVRLHVVESLSGHLATMLNARQLDLALLYGTHTARRWHVSPLLEERLFFVQSARHPTVPLAASQIPLSELRSVPLILPSGTHSLRNVLDAAFRRAHIQPTITAEIDSLAMLMDAVDAGLGASIQPWAATRRFADAEHRFQLAEIPNPDLVRSSFLCSLSNDEMSAAAVATRVLLAVCAREQVRCGAWHGTRLRDH